MSKQIFLPIAENRRIDAMPKENYKNLSKKWRQNYKDKRIGERRSKSVTYLAPHRLSYQLEIIEAIRSGNYEVVEERQE